MIIISGIAGSGKTTQAKLLAGRLGCSFFSMGELLREYGGPKIQARMQAGEVISGQEVLPLIEMVLEQYEAHKKEVITDGFPRTAEEARWLIDKVKAGQIKFTVLLHIEIPEAQAMNRLLARKRKDDTAQTIQKRFEEHQKEEGRMLRLFKDGGLKVIDIDGTGSPETVAARIDGATGS